MEVLDRCIQKKMNILNKVLNFTSASNPRRNLTSVNFKPKLAGPKMIEMESALIKTSTLIEN